jgi:hypothetical protein
MKYFNRYRVAPGSKVKLKDIDPGFKDDRASHKKAADHLAVLRPHGPEESPDAYPAPVILHWSFPPHNYRAEM